MKHRAAGFSLVEVMITVAISAVLIIAVWAVVAAVVKTDDASRNRVEMQLEAATALRKISDLLKMAGPTGDVSKAPAAGDYPAFALDVDKGGFSPTYAFINDTVALDSGVEFINDAGVHQAPVPDPLSPASDPDGYYGPSNEIAFKIPRPAPWYTTSLNAPPGPLPAGRQDNPVDLTGAPVDINGAVTWGVTQNLYQFYLGAYGGDGRYVQPPSTGMATADRQTDVYAIVLVPVVAPTAGPNQLELREYSSQYSAQRYLIRRTVLAYNVERILFQGPKGSPYYLTGNDPATGQPFVDASLGMNQLSITLWMWKNDINKTNSKAVSAYRVKQSTTVNLRSVGQNQMSN
jgi:prepilin-type N-terminal cleavage/methylation domain-containing protein